MGGDATATVSLAVGETLPEVPRVYVPDGGTELRYDQMSVPPVYRYLYEVRPEDVEGSLGVTAVAEDAAGNRAEAHVPDLLVLDFSAPELAGPPELSSPTARPGTMIVVRLSMSESLGKEPVVALVAPDDGRRRPLTRGEHGGAELLYALDVAEDDDGVFDLVVEGGADLAGNPMSRWVGPALVAIDSVPPTATGALVLDKDPPHYRAGESPELRLTASEALALGGPRVTLETLEPRPLDCVPEAGEGWVCTPDRPLTGDELPEGVVRVSVELEDAAGNLGVLGESVVLDFTAPRLGATPVLDRCDGRRLARVADDELWLGLRPACEAGEHSVEIVFSTAERTGAGDPPVVTVDEARVTTVAACTAPAEPPPAIRPSTHCSHGSMPVMKEAVISVPAMTAAGLAILSSRLSIQGT